MRTYTIVLTVLFVALCLLGITAVIELKKESDLQEATIRGLRLQLKNCK